MIDLDALRRAEGVLRRYVPPTPTFASTALSRVLDLDILLKLEVFQPTRVFKVRGALVCLARMVEHGFDGAVVTASAGNHGMSVAYAARLLGLRATVVVPESANPAKVKAILAQGADLRQYGSDFQEAYQEAERLAAQGLRMVHAFDNEDVIAGQGTVGLELVQQADFDTVVVPIGGGGLISGIAAAIKGLRPGVRIIGVEPQGAATMTVSLKAGRLETLSEVRTIADGLAPRVVSDRTLEHVKEFVDDVELVSDEALWPAMRLYLEEEHLIVEPSGAAPLALAMQRPQLFRGQRTVLVVTGGNMAPGTLAELSRSIEANA